METDELIITLIGLMLSALAYFLKKENLRVDKISEKVRLLEVSLAKNGARDCERWNQTIKGLEDRRQDVMNIYENINKRR